MASFVKPEKASNLRASLSKWEREELKTERRKLLTKYEHKREVIAERLRCPLCFSLPCAVIAFMLMILMGIFLVQPHVVGKRLVKTRCRFNRTQQMSTQGHCSHRTEPFPCIRIYVNYNTSSVINMEAVLMENEKSLVHCKKCSFTNGISDLFGRRTTCAWNADLEDNACYGAYMTLFAVENASYPCYYDPDNLGNVARTLEVSEAEAVLSILIPLLVVLLWIAGFILLVYDRYKRRVIDGQILLQRHSDDQRNGKRRNGKQNRPSNHLRVTVDLVETSFEEETEIPEISATPETTPRHSPQKIRRKKKLPCSRAHHNFQFDYLDEGIVLDTKPISPLDMDQPLHFNYLTIETSPRCTSCHHYDNHGASFDLLSESNHFTHFTPMRGNQTTPSNKGRILRYLPESFV